MITKLIKSGLCWSMVLGLLGTFASPSTEAAGQVQAVLRRTNPQGMVWLQNKLYYTDRNNHSLMVWDGQQNNSFWRETGCGPTALVQLSSQFFMVACQDKKSLTLVNFYGQSVGEVTRDQYDGLLDGLNDFVVDKQGGLYISAKGTSNPAAAPTQKGKVYYLDPDSLENLKIGANVKLRLLATRLDNPTGMVLINLGTTLMVAERHTQKLTQFDITAEGLTNRRLFRTLNQVVAEPADVGESAGPVGMRVDNKGNLYICYTGAGQLIVSDRNGKMLQSIDLPDQYPAYLTFAEDYSNLFISTLEDPNNGYNGRNLLKIKL